MTCLARSDLARFVTTGEQPAHVDDCLDCRRALDQQRAVRRALQALPAPVLSDAHRRVLEAETLASIGQKVPVHRPWRWAVAAVAAAAVVLVVVRPRSPVATPCDAPPVAMTERIALSDRGVARESVPPPRGAPSIGAGEGAVLTHTPGEQRDAIALADGSVEIDTRGARDVDVRIGRTVVRVDDARVKIRAHDHAVVSVEVIVGSARVIGPDQQVTLERDTLWTAAPPPTSAALTAFRDAWVALRAGRDREAIALFDRATDPTVAEEATYWAAVAAMRAGDAADAKQRFSEFIARFPSSPYADKARAALRPR